MHMLEIAEGDFIRGCDESTDPACGPDEKPSRVEHLPTFFIDEHEVTVGEYEECRRQGACQEPTSCWERNPRISTQQDCRHPVTCIDWRQASAYCVWVGKRLPSEAEWEKACRGASGQKWPWGDLTFAEAGKVANIPDASTLGAYPDWGFAIRDYDDGFVGTAPTGSFPKGRSPCGALDMIGNVWEFTADTYDDSVAPGAPRAGEAPDPNRRAVRGGSWRYDPVCTRCADRNSRPLESRMDDVGFRCARSP
jgi:formylglycine-generating enzyme required for sulfatase activity